MNDVPRIEDLPDVLTAEHIAAVLQCSTGHVWRLVREKQIPTIKVGRMVRVYKRIFVEWLERSGANDVA